MNMLYGFNSPEFFDRALFENFIDLLRERGVLKAGEGGNLEFDEVLVRVAADAQLVLSEQIRHSILQVTSGLGIPPAAAGRPSFGPGTRCYTRAQHVRAYASARGGSSAAEH